MEHLVEMVANMYGEMQVHLLHLMQQIMDIIHF